MNFAGLSHIKSTLFGIAMILYAISGAGVAMLDADAATVPDWDKVGIEVMAGAALIKAQFPAKTPDPGTEPKP